ncbi:hypothetical protein SAMN05421820_107183 [Pedobacter steynii]|uniref:Uncharacterized protein n=1 Tax=Pedobacter steynii TaxID=430522 RepID=A0A1H0AS87_9SPHI|nr:hypothetical protein [Pedobacter steynii]NQX41278.1 hypothetical protein [Pedobacter steynii]SDN36261.1 hypothetical protein SAMN05421820_107183 [Pedobacter steynii]
MEILAKIKLEKRVIKSKSNENILLVLFDNSSEFVLLESNEKGLEVLYYHDLEFIILDGCFGEADSIWFAGLKSEIIEWDFKGRKVLRNCGEVKINSLDSDLSGYSCISTITQRNLLIAANLGSFRLEFFNLDTLKPVNHGIALTEIYTKQICVHPGGHIIAVLITDSEDTGKIRFFELKGSEIRLYKKYINTLFAPGVFTFDLGGDRLIIGGGYPPFSYQINEFPSLNIIDEFIDDNGLDIPEPWGDTNGISFNSDIEFKDENFIYVPYFNGDVVTLEINTGKIVESFKCNGSPSVSLSRLGNTDLYACSSVNGEICLLRLKSNLKNDTKDPAYLPSQTTTDNLFLPLIDMEEFISESDEPLLIS